MMKWLQSKVSEAALQHSCILLIGLTVDDLFTNCLSMLGKYKGKKRKKIQRKKHKVEKKLNGKNERMHNFNENKNETTFTINSRVFTWRLNRRRAQKCRWEITNDLQSSDALVDEKIKWYRKQFEIKLKETFDLSKQNGILVVPSAAFHNVNI